MRFVSVLCCLFAVLSSCDKVKSKTEIAYKIPDPLRDGIKINKVNHAIITEYRTDEVGKFKKWDFTKSVGYDSFGNINSYWFDRFIYDSNGFKIVRYYDGCYTSKEAIFYIRTKPFELLEKAYYLKNYKWENVIDTTDTSSTHTLRTFKFNTNGNLIKIKYRSRINTTYTYDSLGRLATIIDSLDRNGDDYDLPVRKEFIYNDEGNLSQINELNRSNLLTSGKVNKKGLIDSIYYFDKQKKIEKLEVYEYKY